VVSAATAALVLGGEPGLRDLGEHRLKDLVHPERLYQVVAPDLPAEFPPLRSAGGTLTILPVPRTNFVARSEVDAVAALVVDERMVTLTGAGGAGKTRLALEAARRVKDSFPDGVVFVDLSPVLHPDLVATAVIGTLGLDASATSAAERLQHHLAQRAMLLLLDNFEQILDAAPFVGRLVESCPHLHALATSRSPLRVAGEQEFPVPPLDLPDPSLSDPQSLLASPAVQLFVDRARRVQPTFALTSQNAAAVAAITRRLDGLPLALELAAARIRLLPPSAIAARLAETGSAQLSAKDRDVPDRQRTLDSVIGWSYDLLDEPARSAFRRLSVFVGGGRLDEIEVVLADDDALDVLGSLLEQSLLRQSEVDGDVRLRMLVTIAEFAAARLADAGDEAATKRRHADAYLALAEAAAPSLTGWDQGRWLDRLERDHDNLRAAFDRCLLDGDGEHALRFAAALWRFWQIRGHLDEGARRVGQALRMGHPDLSLRARALEAAGGIAWWRGEIAQARDLYQEALDIVLPTGDLAATANARYNLALALGFDLAHDRAHQEMVRARQEAREAGDRRVEAWAVWGLSDIGVARGDWDLAVRSAEESLEMFRALDDPFGIGWSLFMTASGLGRSGTGQLALARDYYQQGMRLFARFHDLSAMTLHCWGLARVEAATGRPRRALRLIGASRALKQRSGAGLLDVNEEILAVFDVQFATSQVSAGVPQSEADTLIAEGMRFSPEEAVAYVLDELPEPDEPVG
jgi:predicted ATPase